MCRVSHSPLALSLAQQGPLVKPVMIPNLKLNLSVASANKRLSFQPSPVQVVPSKPKRGSPSILRKSSYAATETPLKRTKRYACVPDLVAVEGEEASCSSISRSSSEESLADLLQAKTSTARSSELKSKKISFSKRVLVQEFVRAPGEKERTFYSARDYEGFQYEVLQIIRKYESDNGENRNSVRVFHSHPALALDATDEDEVTATLQREIRKVLLVDSHDLCLNLFFRTIRRAFPHVSISTATDSQSALRLCERSNYDFDIILAEERMGLFRRQSNSGSSLLRTLSQLQKVMPKKSLFVGLSAHLDTDRAMLEENGADLCWGKPPPALDSSTVDELLQTLLVKRGKA